MRTSGTIFYSWQSDLPNATNRSFIERALEGALKTLRADEALKVEPVMDRDTAGISGSPDITTSILSKIDAADVVVSDVSIMTPVGAERPAPNPNVLFELGYAVHGLGLERIIQVQNVVFGGPELLPFDLRGKRTLTYRAEVDEADRSSERKALEGKFVEAIRPLLDRKARNPDVVTDVLSALEEQRPSAGTKLRVAVMNLIARFDGLTPDWNANRGKEKELLAPAIEATLPIATDMARLSEAAAPLLGQQPALIPAFMLLSGELLSRFSANREGLRYQEHDFDLQKFFTHEVFTGFIAILMRHHQWGVIGDVLGRSIAVKNPWLSNAGSERFDKLSDWAELLDERRDGLSRYDLLEARHTAGELGALVPFDEFADADYFLFLRGQMDREENEQHFRWRLWTWRSLWRRKPTFLMDAESRVVARQVATALGTSSVEDLRLRLDQRGRELSRFTGPLVGSHPLDQFEFERIGRR